MTQSGNGTKKLTSIVAVIGCGVALLTFALGRLMVYESQAKHEQKVEDDVETLRQFRLDHLRTHEAIERDIHGAVLVAQQSADVQQESSKQLRALASQVSGLAVQVSRNSLQIAQLAGLQERVRASSAKIEELTKEIGASNEELNKAAKRIKKKLKEAP